MLPVRSAPGIADVGESMALSTIAGVLCQSLEAGLPDLLSSGATKRKNPPPVTSEILAGFHAPLSNFGRAARQSTSVLICLGWRNVRAFNLRARLPISVPSTVSVDAPVRLPIFLPTVPVGLGSACPMVRGCFYQAAKKIPYVKYGAAGFAASARNHTIEVVGQSRSRPANEMLLGDIESSFANSANPLCAWRESDTRVLLLKSPAVLDRRA